jgi:hypothetical protein
MASQRDAERALDLHERELSALPNVVGLGVRPVDGPGPPEYQVAVYVSKKVPRGGLGPSETIPEALEVPSGDGAVAVPITVIESGEFTFE